MATGGISLSARALNRLTDRGIRAFLAAAAQDARKVKKISDGGALYLLLTPTGTPVWRVKYRIGGKEKTYSIGQYPAVTLEAARRERDRVRSLVLAGRDPTQARVVDRAAAVEAGEGTFAVAAADWLERQRGEWQANTYETARRAIERDVLPSLGRLPISEIRPSMVGRVVDTINARGSYETASKVLWLIRSIFEHALERADSSIANPADRARTRLRRVRTPGRRAALLEIEALRGILRRADVEALSPVVRMANRLIAFTAARPGNAITAAWSQFELDTEDPRWIIPRASMKVKNRPFDHTVLLGPTIAEELRAWRGRIGGNGYLFPSPTLKRPHITVEGLDRAYSRTLEQSGKHSPHGWRSSFSTLAREAGFARDVVELTLDHIADTQVVRAYDRGERLAERRKLMNWWDSQLAGEL